MDEFPIIEGVKLIGRQVAVGDIVIAVLTTVALIAMLFATYLFLVDDEKPYNRGFFMFIVAALLVLAVLVCMWIDALKPVYTIEVSDNASFTEIYNQLYIQDQIGDNGYKVKVKR